MQGRQDGRRACVFNPQAPVGLGWHPLVAPDEGVFDAGNVLADQLTEPFAVKIGIGEDDHPPALLEFFYLFKRLF